MCMEEAGSKVNHRRKKGDRTPGIMHCDLATFEASTDGHKYCLVAAVTIEVNHESKLLPFLVPMPKKDALVSSPTRKFEIYVGRRTLHCLILQLISHLLMAEQSEWLGCSRPLCAGC